MLLLLLLHRSLLKFALAATASTQQASGARRTRQTPSPLLQKGSMLETGCHEVEVEIYLPKRVAPARDKCGMPVVQPGRRGCRGCGQTGILGRRGEQFNVLLKR